MTAVKMVEMLGESQSNWNDAVQQALREASKHVSNITGVEVLNLTVGVEDGKISEYKANVKIAYTD
ncbi:MAG: dodecin domain-containing protein [Firmicutes bacterium]|nr:dodecin domain-containing protein [Bacillota bacterium]